MIVLERMNEYLRRTNCCMSSPTKMTVVIPSANSRAVKDLRCPWHTGVNDCLVADPMDVLLPLSCNGPKDPVIHQVGKIEKDFILHSTTCEERSQIFVTHHPTLETRSTSSTPMKLILVTLTILFTQTLVVSAKPPAFISSVNSKQQQSLLGLNSMSEEMNPNNDSELPCSSSAAGLHPFAMLPGDPSLILHTNVDLGDKKLEIMKGMLSCYIPRGVANSFVPCVIFVNF